MCNRFLDSFANEVGKRVATCSCLSLKMSCKNYKKHGETHGKTHKSDFQFSNPDVRNIFVNGEFEGIHGYDYTPLFRLFDYKPEFVSMAICYLHEGDVENFMTLIQPLMQFDHSHANPKYIEKRRVNNKVQKALLKKIFLNHLECIPNTLFDDFLVHVGFGSYNERDELRPLSHYENRKRFPDVEFFQQYIIVPFKLWLYVFFSEEFPRTFFSNMLKDYQKKDRNPLDIIPDIPFAKLFTLRPPQFRSYADVVKGSSLISSNEKQQILNTVKISSTPTRSTIEKFVNKLIEKLNCTCTMKKNKFCSKLVYTPQNIRDIFPTIDIEYRPGMWYSDVILWEKYVEGEDTKQFFPLQFLDMAMCYFHEENFVEFFNIISQVMRKKDQEIFQKAKEMISSHVNCVSLSSATIRKYNVNIDMSKWGRSQIYDKTKIFDRINKKDQSDYFDIERTAYCTDYERFGCVKNHRYLNISFPQWLSDITHVKNPSEKWHRIWNKR